MAKTTIYKRCKCGAKFHKLVAEKTGIGKQELYYGCIKCHAITSRNNIKRRKDEKE
jgi:hypothetical protein